MGRVVVAGGGGGAGGAPVGVVFVPAAGPEADLAPVAGTLALTVRRQTAVYRVEEFPAPAEPGGRGFQLVKLAGGSDPEARDYAVLCRADGRAGTCECRGYLRWGRCKHLAALLDLVATGGV